jgi:hypothetical protein
MRGTQVEILPELARDKLMNLSLAKDAASDMRGGEPDEHVAAGRRPG